MRDLGKVVLGDGEGGEGEVNLRVGWSFETTEERFLGEAEEFLKSSSERSGGVSYGLLWMGRLLTDNFRFFFPLQTLPGVRRRRWE